MNDLRNPDFEEDVNSIVDHIWNKKPSYEELLPELDKQIEMYNVCIKMIQEEIELKKSRMKKIRESLRGDEELIGLYYTGISDIRRFLDNYENV